MMMMMKNILSESKYVQKQRIIQQTETDKIFVDMKTKQKKNSLLLYLMVFMNAEKKFFCVVDI